MPAIFIGVGGIGGSIVSRIRQELNTRVAFAGDTPAARQRAQDFHFLLVDTWRDGPSQGFDHGDVFDIPGGAHANGINRRVQNMYAKDAPFANWWPTNGANNPLLVGDFDAGAGQLRLKGKLAYRISLNNTQTILSAVQRAQLAIQDVLLRTGKSESIKVYIVSSLGGGTGSGITLALAQHLHQELSGECRLVGVFPLASVTELGPPPMARQSIWANTDAALREIDYCQRADLNPKHGMAPFLAWNTHTIEGTEPPFQYIYLFGRTNRNGQSLERLTQYIDLIAETLITESFSDMTSSEGLSTRISSTHSNFIQHLEAHPTIGGRSTKYASAAVASVVYPAERIERHLGRRYGIAVLDRLVQVNQAQVRSRVDDFVTQESLTWEGTPGFSTRLEENLELSSGQLAPLPRFRKLQTADEERFQQTNQSQSTAYVNQVRADFQAFLGEQFNQHLRQRRTVVVAEYGKSDQGIRRFATGILTEGGPSALGQAHAAVAEVHAMLNREWATVNYAIEGNPQATSPSEGSKKDLLALQEKWDGGVRQLSNGFGRLTQRSGKDAKARFFSGTWRPLREAHLNHERLLAARNAYSDLIAETDKVERALRELIEQVGRLRRELELSVTTDIGEHGASGVLDLSVLDDPKLVAHCFREALESAEEQGVDACARSVTSRELLRERAEHESTETMSAQAQFDGIVLDAFRQKVASQSRYHDSDFKDHLAHAIVSDGVERLGNRVRELTIWDALVAEFDARRTLGLEDDAVATATSAVAKDKAAAERAGAPPKEWRVEGIRYFIREKLHQCQNRAQPYWQLNHQMPTQFPEAPEEYRFFVLATDHEAYAEASTTLGIDGVLESTATQMGAGAPISLPGRDRIVIYARGGAVPLFYLADGELTNLRTATTAVAHQGKFLYTDKRFQGLVDDVIRPEESDEARRQYSLAMSLQLGLARVKTDGGVVITDARWNHARSEFGTAQLFDRELRDSEELNRTFETLVDEEMLAISPAERRQELLQASERVARLLDRALEDDERSAIRLWRDTNNIIKTRLHYGRYTVNV